MVAGIDRYYQIARCLRDEDLRADRQYEFMQLDAEMSFVDQDDVLEAISEAVIAAAEAVDRRAPADDRAHHVARGDEPLRRRQARPALRDGAHRADRRLRGDRVQGVRRSRLRSRASTPPGKAEEYGRNKLDGLTDRAKQIGAKGLVWLKVAADGSLESPVVKFLVRDRAGRARRERLDADAGRPAADRRRRVGRRRARCSAAAQRPRPSAGARGPYRYVWVIDFPLFVGRRRGDRAAQARSPPVLPAASRRPRPVRDRPDDGARAGLRPRAQRLGARLGSIRIHETELQRRVFDALGISDEEADRKFGFFLNPFDYGAPPHGGFAFGIDRLVAILAGEENIREVIAFPKTQSGHRPDDERADPRRPAPARRAGAADPACHDLRHLATTWEPWR